MKPHLFRFGGLWCCSNLGAEAYGETIWIAYNRWAGFFGKREQVRKRLYDVAVH